MLTKTKLNSIEVLISRGLINSYSSHDKFISVNNMLTELDDMKEALKNPKTINMVDSTKKLI